MLPNAASLRQRSFMVFFVLELVNQLSADCCERLQAARHLNGPVVPSDAVPAYAVGGGRGAEGFAVDRNRAVPWMTPSPGDRPRFGQTRVPRAITPACISSRRPGERVVREAGSRCGSISPAQLSKRSPILSSPALEPRYCLSGMVYVFQHLEHERGAAVEPAISPPAQGLVEAQSGPSRLAESWVSATTNKGRCLEKSARPPARRGAAAPSKRAVGDWLPLTGDASRARVRLVCAGSVALGHRFDPVLDQDIRRALRRRVARLHAEHPETRIVEELDFGFTARADLVVLNGRIEGFEIKSDRDTLVRLAHQAKAYEAVCDRVWLVTTYRFADAAMQQLPSWWGVLVASSRRGEPHLVRRRAARAHHEQRAGALLDLLWRDELASLCKRYAPELVSRRATARAMRLALADGQVSGRRLAKEVRSGAAGQGKLANCAAVCIR